MKIQILEHKVDIPARNGRISGCVSAVRRALPALKCGIILATLALCTLAPSAVPQNTNPSQPAPAKTQRQNLPPRVIAAQRFLAARGWAPGQKRTAGAKGNIPATIQIKANGASPETAATATWQPLGPMAVQTQHLGLVTGRVAAIALDPSDPTGNRLYIGTTGGGVWAAQNAGVSNPSSVIFTPLTDTVAALGPALDASISIGALTVQPGGTGVILAGTGDPNDVLDSYYGAGILRSTDGGNTWSLIWRTTDAEQSLGIQDHTFVGEGFAGFAWSTRNPQVVVAAVSQAYEGTLVNATRPGSSYQGLYYSQDSGASWHLATITDGVGKDVQGPLIQVENQEGNSATSVVWNPVRKLFVAAVRFHGYYQSTDGITWTRMAAQPGANLTTRLCPNDSSNMGSIACPIYRGVLAVDPFSGDTFAWTVDGNDQDQGIWQDQCIITGGNCSNQTVTFAKQWSTAALETNTTYGAATIIGGSYNLALAAVPPGLGAGQDTQLFAGASDIWKCSLAMGCVWRNTTNSTTCKSAQVGEFQHALEWNRANPQEIFVGNDSGLWRSTDAVGEAGPVCSVDDASHFQNLNGNLGSLAEVVSLSDVTSSPYKMMAALGANGTAGVKSAAAVADWPQILDGFGGTVAIDPINSDNWYANNEPGVSIYKCSQAADCTAADFGTKPVISNSDVGGDGDTMLGPAPFLVDPLDSSQLIAGTCRVWRGPADGSGWKSTNAISSILDNGQSTGACSGDALIRSMAAIALPGNVERVYVGMHGFADGGANLAGHVFSAIVDPASSALPSWKDLTLDPVVNNSDSLNKFGLGISSIAIDPHDTTGNTVYLTVAGIANSNKGVLVVYRTTDSGTHWTNLTANVFAAPANSIVVDPLDANTVYLATDRGVFFTTDIASCGFNLSNCWSAFGTGLPAAPVVALRASESGVASPVLVAATYGRGIWQTPLFTAGTALTAAAVDPASLSFSDQKFGTSSNPQTVMLTNTGTNSLTVSSVSMTGDFSETDNCANVTLAPATSCRLQVSFRPGATGNCTGQMIVAANVYGGQIVVDLTGTGTSAGAVALTPPSIDFGQIQVGATSAAFQVQASNSGGIAVPISAVTITAPFLIATNMCGTTTLAPVSSCQVQLKFAPTQAGGVAGTLTFTDGAGTQTVSLNGVGAAAPTDVLSSAALNFPGSIVGSLSDAKTIMLSNSGDMPLTGITISASGPFQTSDNCGPQLAGNAACTISVVFAPTQLGGQSGTLTVTDLLRVQAIALSGVGVSPPALNVDPNTLTFSSQQPGVASSPQTVTIRNTGGASMSNVGFQITGPAAGSYSVGSTTCGATLNSGGSCTAQVVFTPAVTGAIAATLTISSSTSGVTPVSVSLNGSGQLSGGLGSNPAQLSFPPVGVGQSSAALPVTVRNSSSYAIGSVALAITGPFSLSQNTCTGSLAAGTNCTTNVVFKPTASGATTGTLTITSDVVASPASVLLSGAGFDFSVGVSGTSSITVAAGQTANYTMTISPASGAQGTFTYTCGTLPANAQCTFNPPATTLGIGATGNVNVGISTGKSGSARLEGPVRWVTLPIVCGFLLLPLSLRRCRNALLFGVLLVVLAGGVSSCTSSGGGTGGGTGGGGNGSATPPGTYTIPVTVSSTGISHAVTITMVVD